MELPKRGFVCFCALILFVQLSHGTPTGAEAREKRHLWQAGQDVVGKIRNTIGTGINKIFHIDETTENPTENETAEGRQELSNEEQYRQIITTPIRCPPDHILVKGKCRIDIG